MSFEDASRFFTEVTSLLSCQIIEANHAFHQIIGRRGIDLTLQLFDQYAERFKQRTEEHVYGCEMEVSRLGTSKELKP